MNLFRNPRAESPNPRFRRRIVLAVGAACVVIAGWMPAWGQRPAGDTGPQQALVIGGCSLADVVEFHTCASEKAKSFVPPRTSDDVPDFRGYWRSRNNNAAYNVEPAGATFGIPASGGHIIDTPDRLIPYQPWALARRNELRGKGFDDPQAHCAPSGARVDYRMRGSITVLSVHTKGRPEGRPFALGDE